MNPALLLDREAHMGHMFLDCIKKRPNAIFQIDAATGEEETNESVLHRSVQLAQSFRALGLVPGDVLALGGKTHINLHIPYYAAIMNGLPIAGVDPLFKLGEIKTLFGLTSPKIAFCEPELYSTYVQAAKDLGLDTRVYTFGTGANSMDELMELYEGDTPVEDFEPAKFDTEKVYLWLVSSGGTTGKIKLAALKHDTCKVKLQQIIENIYSAKNNTEGIDSQPNKPALNLSPVQWISGFFQAVGMPLLRQIKIMTSAPATPEHIIDIINKYRPVTTMLSPWGATAILKSSKPCDFSCFDTVFCTGGKVYADLLTEFRARLRKGALMLEAYGQTENVGPIFTPNPFGPIGNCGVPNPKNVQTKLVDPETGKEITEPNVTGELWTKTLCFACYYNDPEETARAFSPDGWYMTGDLLYRDENNNYFFVERLKMLIKYRNYHIVPPELEEVIRMHPDVLEVSVTSVPHEEDGEHAVACVRKRPGSSVTAQQIKDLVAENLSESKQLRGGVIFMDQLPMTSTNKVARAKLRQIAIDSLRE